MSLQLKLKPMSRSLGLISLVFTIVLPLHAETTVVSDIEAHKDGHREFSEMDPKLQNLALYAALDGSVLNPVERDEVLPPDPESTSVWNGNRPNLRASLGKITLVFGKKARDKAGKAVVLPISVGFDFERDGVYINRRSGDHKLKNERLEGVRIALGQRRLLKIGYADIRSLGLAVLVPDLERFELGSALICPFDLPPQLPGDGSIDLIQTKFAPDAELDGVLLGGANAALSIGTILTSNNLEPSLGPIDKLLAKDPKVSIRYNPAPPSPELLKQRSDYSPKESVIAGIDATLLQHVASGFRRITSTQEQAWIKKVAWEEGTKLNLQEDKNGNFTTPQHGCYLVYRERFRVTDYSNGPIPGLKKEADNLLGR